MLLKLARVTSELIDSRVAYLERRASENADELFNRLARQAQSEERNDEEAFLMQLTPQQRHAARTFLLRLWEHEASRSTNGNGAQ